MLHALQLLDFSIACFSIQASYASAERIFGDPGAQEGNKEKHTDVSISETTLCIRSYVKQCINNAPGKLGFYSSILQLELLHNYVHIQVFNLHYKIKNLMLLLMTHDRLNRTSINNKCDSVLLYNFNQFIFRMCTLRYRCSIYWGVIILLSGQCEIETRIKSTGAANITSFDEGGLSRTGSAAIFLENG